MFDLVIQGPLNNTSLQHAERYHSEFQNIIVSHWDNDDTSKQPNYKKLKDGNLVELVSQPLPDLSKTVLTRRDSTFFYSLTSTYAGLKKCVSPYVIKMRSDEFYLNFILLKEKFLKNPDKMVCGNIFFNKWTTRPYHIGDHVFLANTQNLLKTYETLLNIYTGITTEPPPWADHTPQTVNTPEDILAKSYLTSKRCPPDLWDKKETLFKYFDVIDINQLSPYVSRWVHADQTYSSNGPSFTWEVSNIKDI